MRWCYIWYYSFPGRFARLLFAATWRSAREFALDRPRQRTQPMPSSALFGLSVAFGFLTWSIVAAQYLWPALSSQPRVEALRPLLLLHSFRFIGLAFLVPGVVSPDLAVAFARPAAYGDLVASVLALLALAALRRRWGIVLVWAFNVWGTADLLYAFYQGNRVGFLPGQLGAAYFIPTFIVPLLLVTHGLMFRLLLQGGGPADARTGAVPPERI
jgi:hypothetical protein